MKEREREHGKREEGGRKEEAKLLLLLLSFIIAHYRADGRTAASAAIVRTWHGDDNATMLARCLVRSLPSLHT